MANMLINLLHFLQVGNCEGYLKTIHEFLPCFVSINRYNYEQNFSYYNSHILSLKEENLEAFQYLHDEGLTGYLSGRSHLMIPMDQMIETGGNW